MKEIKKKYILGNITKMGGGGKCTLNDTSVKSATTATEEKTL
jgi:hypothetical protein